MREKHFLSRSSAQDSGRDPDSAPIGLGLQRSSEAQEKMVPPKHIKEFAKSLDPLASHAGDSLQSDLHMHTAWSDGSASVNTMATAVVASGLRYFAVTDHSRTSKLQGGLTPILWLRQANALTLATPVCPVLHGIEVDILKDGTLDLPQFSSRCC